ncbi:MAG: DUF3828 domain-containing protein [Bacteroidales bacterium]
MRNFLMKKMLVASGMLMAIVGCANAQNTESQIVERVKAIYTEVAKAYPNHEELIEDLPDIDLDGLYCSEEWNNLVNQVGEIDGLSPEGIGFFDADYWIMGQDWQDVSVSDVKAQVVDADHAEVHLVLHNCGSESPLKLLMVKEQGEWKIDDFMDESDDEQYSWKSGMKDYVYDIVPPSEEVKRLAANLFGQWMKDGDNTSVTELSPAGTWIEGSQVFDGDKPKAGVYCHFTGSHINIKPENESAGTILYLRENIKYQYKDLTKTTLTLIDDEGVVDHYHALPQKVKIIEPWEMEDGE